jgi:Txe/YoeB family toxin of Txe-Axe toxin-antitoxin module
MGWKVDDTVQRTAFNAGKHYQVEPSAMRKYHDWKNKITLNNLHPKVAAEAAGDMHYEQLGGRNAGQYTVRLSQQHRVAFTINTVSQTVNVFQIGGHYPDQKN